MDEVALPPGWILFSEDCLACSSKNVMYRCQRKGWHDHGVFTFRVCLSCGHAVARDHTHSKSIGAKLTAEDNVRY